MPRHDARRHIQASQPHIWQAYADEVGIPGASEAASDPRPPRRLQRRPAPRAVAGRAGWIAAVTVVGVLVVASVAVWRGRPTSRHTAQPQPQMVVSPTAENQTTAGEITAVGTQHVEPDVESGNIASRVMFDFGSDRINDNAKLALQNVIVAMNANPQWRLALEGHTDAYGPADHNRLLSEQRARAVKLYLQSAGIAPERLTAEGFGASRPVTTRGAEPNPLNRRVEIYRR